MRQEDRLIEKYGRDPGFKVPDGYFEELNAKIMRDLPPYKEAPKRVDLTLWQRVKPYVYLAAMFAGIWLMMNVFHRVSGSGDLSLENPPAAIAAAMESADEDFFMPGYAGEDDYMLEREVSASYDSIDEFEEDFGYEFKPEFATMKIESGSSDLNKEMKSV